jgi:hypothetical protein
MSPVIVDVVGQKRLTTRVMRRSATVNAGARGSIPFLRPTAGE